MKTDRLLAIIILLLNRGRMSATELAERFEVSVRTVYRDIEAISRAGVPIVAYPGFGGGFAILESFKMDRKMLSPYEIQTMITALYGAHAALNDPAIQNTIEKLKGIEFPEGSPHEPVSMDFSSWNLKKTEIIYLNLLREAISAKHIVRFSYTNAQGEGKEREVEPLMVHFKDRGWYLLGFCRLRQDYRVFKVSRMRNLAVREEPFAPRVIPEGFFEAVSRPDKMTYIRIVLRFAPHIRVRVEDFFDTEQIVEEAGGTLRVEVYYPEDEWVYGIILSFGEAVEVLEPPHLRAIIREKAEKIFRIYKETTS